MRNLYQGKRPQCLKLDKQNRMLELPLEVTCCFAPNIMAQNLSIGSNYLHKIVKTLCRFSTIQPLVLTVVFLNGMSIFHLLDIALIGNENDRN